MRTCSASCVSTSGSSSPFAGCLWINGTNADELWTRIGWKADRAMRDSTFPAPPTLRHWCWCSRRPPRKSLIGFFLFSGSRKIRSPCECGEIMFRMTSGRGWASSRPPKTKRILFAAEVESVFQLAWYALSRSVANDAPDHDPNPNSMFSSGTPLACLHCGNFFIRTGPRQRYCSDPNCQAARQRKNQRNSRQRRKLQKQQ